MLTVNELVNKVRDRLNEEDAFVLSQEEAVQLVVRWAVEFAAAVVNDDE